MKRLLLLALLGSLGSCESDGDLDRDIVTSLPDGDAVGSAVSGIYEVESYVSSCAGKCPEIDYGFITVSTCDVGTKTTEIVTITQADGRLQVDLEANLFVTRMTGGINADGSFDVGGYGTEASGAVTITARAQGTISVGGALTAGYKAVGKGSVEDTSIDCAGTYELTGTRQQ